MSPEVCGALCEGAIPFLGGLYMTLLGLRILGKKPGQDARFDKWHAKYGWLFKFFGPLLMLVSILLALAGLGRPE